MIHSKSILFELDKGEVFGWGNSEYGQLGTKDDMQQLHTPIYLKPTKKCGKVIDVAAGGSFCLALNGKIYIYMVKNIKRFRLY